MLALGGGGERLIAGKGRICFSYKSLLTWAMKKHLKVSFFLLFLLECEEIHSVLWGADPAQIPALNPVWAAVFERDFLLLPLQYPRGEPVVPLSVNIHRKQFLSLKRLYLTKSGRISLDLLVKMWD